MRKTFRQKRAMLEALEGRTLFSATLDWKTVAPMPIPRSEGGSFVADGKMFCFGGFDNATTLTISNEMDAYDPTTNTWTRMADCPVKVNDDPVTVDPVTDTAWCGGFFLNDGFHASNLMYEYHVKTNTWSQGPSLPMNVGAGQMGVVGRTLFYFGGRNAANVGQTNTWSLDLTNPNATWQAKAPMLYTANHGDAVVINNKIYEVGGIVNKEETTSNEKYLQIYDPASNSWSLGPSMPIGLGHIASAVTLADGDIIVAGGQVDGAGQVMSKEVLQYDPNANSWTQLTNLPDYRTSDFVGYVDGELIVTAGNMYPSPYISTTTWEAAYSNSVTPPPPVVPTVNITASSAQQGFPVAFTATLSSAATTAVTANYSLTSGTAPLNDFDSASGTVTFPAGSTQATIDVPTYTDSSNANETFTLTLSSLSSNATFANTQTTESAIGTITPTPVSVVKQPVTVSLANASSTLVSGQMDMFSINVAASDGGIPTGTVTLFENGTQMGSTTVTSTGSTSILVTAPATSGSWSAVYGGDANYLPGTSNTVAQTDLVASPVAAAFGKTSIPANGFLGQPFVATIPVNLTNHGPNQKGYFTLKVFADTAAVGLSASPILLGTAVRGIGLPTKASSPITLYLKKLPANLPAGDYHIVAETIDTHGQFQLITAGQLLHVANPVKAIAMTVTDPLVGKIDTLLLSITNTGNLAARGIAICVVTIPQADGSTSVIHMQHWPMNLKPGYTGTYRVRTKVPAAAAGLTPIVTLKLGTLSVVAAGTAAL